MLFPVENIFNMKNLGEELFMALLRMLIVLVITVALAKPLGEIPENSGERQK